MSIDFRSFTARHRGFTGFAVGVVCTAAVLGGGVAVAAIPSSSTGQFTACVNKTTGAVRIINYQGGKRCTTKETTVNWSRGWRYRGTWAAGTAYAVGDVAVQNGSSYLAKLASTGKSPATNATAWGVVAAKGATGATGATGTNGTNGTNGNTGAQGPAGFAETYVVYENVSTAVSSFSYGVANCPTYAPNIAGGGYEIADSSSGVATVMQSRPLLGENGWAVRMRNGGNTFALSWTVYAVCA